MNDQPDNQATDPELRSNVVKDENYSILICDNPPDYPIKGFLQLCADRRFHACIQRHFQDAAKLDSPEQYWIHADAGGTPKMTHLTDAPVYCYDKMEVRLMGWSAHGNVCGGFPDNPGDDAIEEALYEAMPEIVRKYPRATHFVYFAKLIGVGATAKSVLYCLKYENGKLTLRKD